MSLSASIAAHIPFLRRFARAVTGSAANGDMYAVATIEAMLQDETTHPMQGDARLALFEAFIKIWLPVAERHHSRAEGADTQLDAAGRSIDSISPLPRVAFLLQAMEGFRTSEIAHILGCATDKVDRLLHTASQEIASHLSTSVLIIEDEPIIAMDLEALVTDLGHHVIKVVRTRHEVAALIDHINPGLILADIQLADNSSGLDAVKDMLTISPVPVVFITAYPERLLTGERPEPTFMITKPFRAETVKAIVSQALFFDHKARLAS